MVTEMKRNLKMMGRRNESQNDFIGSNESNHQSHMLSRVKCEP